jgi:FkbM family methyltransferase
MGPYCLGLVTEANGMFLLAPKDDVGVGRRLSFNGSYDSGNLERYQRLLGPETRLLVVGAHVGSIMLPLAKSVYEVVGIEANPEVFQLLQMNVAVNGLTNCQLYNVAASDEECSLEFLASKTNSGGGKLVPRERRLEFVFDNPQTITVRGAPLDDELSGEFDVVLMDIEGAEYRAMAGMQRILSGASTFICELLPNHLEHAAGCTFDEFVARIPEKFQWFSLATDDRVVDRSGLPELYRTVHRDSYFGGADLVCSAKAP